MILADQKDVFLTIGKWINDNGSVRKVAKRLGLHPAALYRILNYQDDMSASRWEKWKQRYSDNELLYEVTICRLDSKSFYTQYINDLSLLYRWVTEEKEMFGNVIITSIEKLED